MCEILNQMPNENFYSVQQEIHYHRYLSLYSLVVVASSLTGFQKAACRETPLDLLLTRFSYCPRKI